MTRLESIVIWINSLTLAVVISLPVWLCAFLILTMLGYL